MVRHMGPPMDRKTPKTTDRYMCQGCVEKPLAIFLSISEANASIASVTTDRRKICKYT